MQYTAQKQTIDLDQYVSDEEKPVGKAPPLLTTEQVLDRLGISAATLYNRIRDRRFHPIRKGNRRFYHPEEVEQEEKRIFESKRLRPNSYTASMPSAPSKNSPTKPRRGDHVYASNAPYYEGQVASDAFKLFGEGKDQRGAIVELKQTVEVIEYLYAKWKSLGSEWHLEAKHLHYLRERFGWNEVPPTPDGLLKAITAYVHRESQREVQRALAGKNPEAIHNELSTNERKKLLEEDPGQEGSVAILSESERKALTETESAGESK